MTHGSDFRIAQTNLQLYNQLLGQDRGRDELLLIRKAYDLSCLLYSGYYQADGKPFVAHTVGVASILAHLGLPSPVVAFALVHNVYANGDFGDGLQHRAAPARREKVRAALGAEVETMVHAFRSFRITPQTIDRFEAGLDSCGAFERNLLLTDLADHLEKYVDRGVLYFGDGDWVTSEVALLGARLTAMAGRLGQPELGRMLQDAFDAVAGMDRAPEILRPAKRKYLALTPPLSLKPRLYPLLVAYFRRKPWKRRGA